MQGIVSLSFSISGCAPSTPVMCVGGSIGIWVAGFGSASCPNPPLSLSLAIIPPLLRTAPLFSRSRDSRRVSFRFFFPYPAAHRFSINLGKQSSGMWRVAGPISPRINNERVWLSRTKCVCVCVCGRGLRVVSRLERWIIWMGVGYTKLCD